MIEGLKIVISAEIGKLKSELKKAESALGGVGSDAKKAGAKVKSGLKDGEKAAKSFKDKVKDMSDEVDKKFGKIADAGKKMAAGFAGVIAGIAAGMVALVEGTEEYRQGQAQLDAAFSQANLSAQSAAGTYAHLYQVIGDDAQAVESAANIAMLASSEQEAAKWAELASGVLGTFHDTLQPEAFYEAANETLKLGEATGAFTQMLEQTGVMSVDEFNKKLAECSTEAEKQAFMLEVSNNALGDAGEEYDKATESIQKQRDAQRELKDTMAQLGEAVSPIVTAFTNFANDALAKVTPYIQDLAEKYTPILQEVLDKVGEAIGKVIDWIVANWDTISQVASIIIPIAAAIMLVVGAITVATTVWGILSAVISTNIIVLVIMGIVAVIILIATHFEEFKAIVEKVMDKVKGAIEKVWNFIKGIISIAIAIIKAPIEFVINLFLTLYEKIREFVLKIKEAIVGKFQEIKQNMQDKIQAAKDKVLGIFTSIKDGIQERINNVKNKVKSVFDTVKGFITNPIETAKNTVYNLIEKIKGFFDFKWELPKLKLPHIEIDGKFSLAPPSVPKFKINWNALGGVFDKPTLFDYGGGLQGIGEDGAEAVVPLEKNTQWLDRIADKLAAKQGNVPIVLQVDGKTFAQVSIDSINALTRQKGTLGLNIV